MNIVIPFCYYNSLDLETQKNYKNKLEIYLEKNSLIDWKDKFFLFFNSDFNKLLNILNLSKFENNIKLTDDINFDYEQKEMYFLSFENFLELLKSIENKSNISNANIFNNLEIFYNLDFILKYFCYLNIDLSKDPFNYELININSFNAYLNIYKKENKLITINNYFLLNYNNIEYKTYFKKLSFENNDSYNILVNKKITKTILVSRVINLLKKSQTGLILYLKLIYEINNKIDARSFFKVLNYNFDMEILKNNIDDLNISLENEKNWKYKEPNITNKISSLEWLQFSIKRKITINEENNQTKEVEKYIKKMDYNVDKINERKKRSIVQNSKRKNNTRKNIL